MSQTVCYDRRKDKDGNIEAWQNPYCNFECLCIATLIFSSIIVNCLTHCREGLRYTPKVFSDSVALIYSNSFPFTLSLAGTSLIYFFPCIHSYFYEKTLDFSSYIFLPVAKCNRLYWSSISCILLTVFSLSAARSVSSTKEIDEHN